MAEQSGSSRDEIRAFARIARQATDEELAPMYRSLGADAIQQEQQIGALFKEWRSKAGLSQAQLADRLTARGTKIHQTAIAKIEAGTRPIRLAEAILVCNCLGIEPITMFIDTSSHASSTDLEQLSTRVRDSTADLLQQAGELALLHTEQQKAAIEAIERGTATAHTIEVLTEAGLLDADGNLTSTEQLDERALAVLMRRITTSSDTGEDEPWGEPPNA